MFHRSRDVSPSLAADGLDTYSCAAGWGGACLRTRRRFHPSQPLFCVLCVCVHRRQRFDQLFATYTGMFPKASAVFSRMCVFNVERPVCPDDQVCIVCPA